MSSLIGETIVKDECYEHPDEIIQYNFLTTLDGKIFYLCHSVLDTYESNISFETITKRDMDEIIYKYKLLLVKTF